MQTHPLNIDLSEFPIRENVLYVNHAGTAPIPRRSAEALKQFADEVSGYASAIYHEWTARQTAARKAAATLIGARPEEIAFSTSTTHGINTVALGIDWKPGDVVIAEERTFPANWLPWKDIAVPRGAEIWPWPERNYRYELEDLEARLKQGGVRLVAATTANFATGFRADMEAIGKLCHEHGALLCVDAIQTLGVFPLDVKKCHIDFLAADSHKWLLGPEGAAIFYCAEDKLDVLKNAPIGWLGRKNFTYWDALDLPPDPTARRFEEGSPNLAGTLAMGESIGLLLETGIERIRDHNLSLCAYLRAGMKAKGWIVATPEGACASILSSHKEGVDPDAIVKSLWKEAKVWAAARRGFLRISPHFYQTTDDMQRILDAI